MLWSVKRQRWHQEGQDGGGGILEWTWGTSEHVTGGDGKVLYVQSTAYGSLENLAESVRLFIGDVKVMGRTLGDTGRLAASLPKGLFATKCFQGQSATS